MQNLKVAVQAGQVVELCDTMAETIKACVETGRVVSAIKLVRGVSSQYLSILEAKALVKVVGGQDASSELVEVTRLAVCREVYLIRPKV